MRVAIVNDTSMAVEAMRRVLVAAREHEVAWVARDGEEAIRLCAADTPDLILMDIFMAGMDGVEATRRIMKSTPCAVLVVTGTVKRSAAKIFEALGAGALDVVETPSIGNRSGDEGALEFLAKVRLIGKLIGPPKQKPILPGVSMSRPRATLRRVLVAVGASAGGPGALADILSNLPGDLSGTVVIVQHIDSHFASGLAAHLNARSAIPVDLAQEGSRLEVGRVLLAGTGNHLIMVDSNSVGYTPEPTECAYRPSVDVFFESVARTWTGDTIGVLLTGMGRDGALGLRTLRARGAHTIAQDQKSSVVYGMPKAAVELGAATEVLPLDRIAPALARLVKEKLRS